MPATDRYDGPAYRVLRKYTATATAPPTWVLSAEFGLIPADRPIPDYDREMSPSRARALRPQIAAAFDDLASRSYTDVLVCAGRAYTTPLGDVSATLGCPAVIASGSIGRQLAVLHDWLHGAPPRPPSVSRGQPVVFRGRTLTTTTDEVLRLARRRATEDPGGAGRYAGWVVAAGPARVAPKWLLSELTGVPVSDFRTADARRVLTALGIEVLRA